MARFGLLALFLVAGAQADNTSEAAKADLKKMAGAWTCTKYVKEGKAATADELKGIQLTIEKDVSTFTRQAEKSTGTYKLDPSKKPPQLDIKLSSGPNKGKTIEAIYQIKDDTLRIALASEGKPRPNNFKEEAGRTIEVWKRDAKAAVAKAAEPAKAAMKQPEKPKQAAKPVPPPFVDKNLEAAVRAVLHEPTGDLTDEKLGNVHVLEAAGKQIKDLRGLDKCQNLALVNLARNQVTDVTPLKGLSVLQSLDLSNNQLKDITPLAGLAKLQYLEVSHNQIDKLDAVAGMTALNSLYASHNQVSSLAPIAKLAKLWTLSVSNNRIQDISVLEKLPRLQTVDLGANQISDLRGLAKQTELSLLILDKNRITDLGPLVSMLEADAKGQKRMAPFLRLYLRENPVASDKGGQLGKLRALGVRIEGQ